MNVIESKNHLIFTNCEMFNEIEIKTPWYYPVKRSLGQLNLKQDQKKSAETVLDYPALVLLISRLKMSWNFNKIKSKTPFDM